jgi:hypothetical protein
MKSHNALFETIEQGLHILQLAKPPPKDSFCYHDLDKTMSGGYKIKLGMQDSATPSLWIGSTDTVKADHIFWESRGIKATQGPDTSGTTNSWIVIETQCLHSASIFISLATNISAKCIEQKSTKRGTVKAALDAWRDIFLYDNNGLSPQQLAGLIGELLTLEEIAATGHGANALETWHGFEGERHDFSRGQLAIETKTKTTSGLDITINGMTQLQPPADGKLVLRFMRLEETLDQHLSLPGIVERICGHGVGRGMLEEGILKAKASQHQITQPTKFFKLIEKTAYQVNEGFPRIIDTSFEDKKCPKGISGIEYRTNLGFAEGYKMNEATYINFLKSF